MSSSPGQALIYRHLQCIDDQVATDPAAHRPTHNATRVQIQYHRQIQPALACLDVGDIGCPAFIRALCREVLLEQVVRNRVLRVTLCCDLKRRLGTSLETG